MDNPVKPQPTIRGYLGWALETLVKARGVSLAEGTAWVLDHWVEANREMLKVDYGISVQAYRDSQKNVPQLKKVEAATVHRLEQRRVEGGEDFDG